MENEFRREVFVLKPTSKEEKEKAKLRVAAYCRVSTDSEDQVHSFIAQVNTDELYLVEKGIRDEQIRIEELADLAIQSKFNKDKYTEAIADCSQRIKDLRERRDMLTKQNL